MRGHLALRQGAGRPLHPRLQRELESPADQPRAFQLSLLPPAAAVK
ncbi:hypothetical protein [Dictyobacter vulcani]|nr:hypothetical protein [Dictyobacter vulcani]